MRDKITTIMCICIILYMVYINEHFEAYKIAVAGGILIIAWLLVDKLFSDD